jgi:hypothetical protein
MLLQILFVLLLFPTSGAFCQKFFAMRRSEKHGGQVHELAGQTIWFQFSSGVANIWPSQLVQNFIDRCDFTSDNNFFGTTSLSKTFLLQSLWKWTISYNIFDTSLISKKVQYFCLLYCHKKTYACNCFSLCKTGGL